MALYEFSPDESALFATEAGELFESKVAGFKEALEKQVLLELSKGPGLAPQELSYIQGQIKAYNNLLNMFRFAKEKHVKFMQKFQEED